MKLPVMLNLHALCWLFSVRKDTAAPAQLVAMFRVAGSPEVTGVTWHWLCLSPAFWSTPFQGEMQGIRDSLGSLLAWHCSEWETAFSHKQHPFFLVIFFPLSFFYNVFS